MDEVDKTFKVGREETGGMKHSVNSHIYDLNNQNRILVHSSIGVMPKDYIEADISIEYRDFIIFQDLLSKNESLFARWIKSENDDSLIILKYCDEPTFKIVKRFMALNNKNCVEYWDVSNLKGTNFECMFLDREDYENYN
ncbi:MAG: hypothetical protein EKK61_00040 [Rickettsiales bacterium]|nr:MAG: hypothetical protein EKK61_00040 [Rickettsiales bacterium]